MKKNVRIEKISESEVKNVFGGCIPPDPGTCTCCPTDCMEGLDFLKAMVVTFRFLLLRF